MILYIHKEITDKLNIADIRNQFFSAPPERQNRFGKFVNCSFVKKKKGLNAKTFLGQDYNAVGYNASMDTVSHHHATLSANSVVKASVIKFRFTVRKGLKLKTSVFQSVTVANSPYRPCG